MKQEQWEGKIIPAQLNFLAIYSPPLGTTDETFKEQVVFYYSRADRDVKSQKKKAPTASAEEEASASREIENEKLRQIGLAQGMVDFARSFSDDQTIDSVDTEKSRIILHELERGWWLLASIDLTRLPSMVNSRSKDVESNNSPEYSSREVSPTSLLLAQVLTANRTFLLHHGPTISELFMRSTREKFCNILDRFWSRFCRNWEVLLHGNPAVEVFGGMKLAAGGELGVGVGEENWGSGEREVLEDLVRQTEGLVDLTVSRFGQAAPPEKDYAADRPTEQTIAESDLPWLGSGRLPDEADGVIFGGTGAIARSSLRDISAWVQQVYTYGEYAYGVKDNPQRQRRKRRRKQLAPYDRVTSPAPDQPTPASTNLRKLALDQSQQQTTPGPDEKPEDTLPFPLPHDPRPPLHDRVASHDHATGTPSPQVASHPGIPPPIVNAAEESLKAAAKAAASTRSESSTDKPQGGSTFGISSKWMNYLTLGLSGSGTRSRSSSPAKRPPPSRRTSSMSSTKTLRPAAAQRTISSRQPDIPEGDEGGPMQTLDPAPDGHELEAQLVNQKYQENKGHFLIGIKGDLDSLPNEDDNNNHDNDSMDSESEIGRKVLRTLQIELPERQISKEEDAEKDAENAKSISPSADHSDSEDGQSGRRYQRLRVLVYVHRPFIYTFLFEPRFPSLQISSYYSRLHAHVRPLHKQLLRSTALATVAERIAEAHTSPTGSQAANPENAPYQPPHSSPVFDLVFDPLTLTMHTSIPNIPDPGTHAAEGLATTSTGRIDPPPWTRLEAINVHSQILNTLAATASNKHETERTSKTSRGWWVVWMRIPATPTDQGSQRDRYDECRTAFLVRKASDSLPALPRPGGPGRVVSGMSSMGGMFGFGSSSAAASIAEEREDGTGVGWGLGIDARKYVEGLLSLNR